jgi:hypothetical protein
MTTQPPLEDIHAIANRFQAWAGAQPPIYKDGVRELTYDEAIRSKKNHINSRKAASDPAKPTPVANARRKKTTKSQKLKRTATATRHSGFNRSRKSQETALTAVSGPMTFRQVLAEKVSILPVAAEPRTTALSMRISSTEHALLRRRATDANISVSCYLRNCFLEVESLRAQLTRTIAEQEMASAQMPQRISALSSCMQMVRRLFFRKSTALAIRA